MQFRKSRYYLEPFLLLTFQTSSSLDEFTIQIRRFGFGMAEGLVLVWGIFWSIARLLQHFTKIGEPQL
jgi:hypothetical protein